ncbi:hypothetical protein VF09_26860 [Nostoc linckia z9]|nr:hypothetical protein VF09_26860 [Nostoc linckia z9]
MGSAPDYSHRRNLSFTGSRWILQPDNLRLGHGVWGMGYGVWGMGHGALRVRSEAFGVKSYSSLKGMGYGAWGMGH